MELLIQTGKLCYNGEWFLFPSEQRDRIIFNYFRNNVLYFCIYNDLKEGLFFCMCVFKCGLIFWWICSFWLFFIKFICHVGFLMENWAQVKMLFVALLLLNFFPTSPPLTVILELVILVVTRDYQLLCLFGSFRVLFQIIYSQKVDNDLLLL